MYEFRKLKNINEDYKKVLHIWDTAGVASLLSRELNKNGYNSKVIMRSIHDPFGMTKFYGQESVDLEGTPYLTYCKRVAENYGIIHIHGIPSLVPEYKKLFPKKKIILQFHGSDLTEPHDIDELVKNSKYADAIICSSPDLEQYVLKHNELGKPYVCVNAVDTSLFKPIDNIEKLDKALYIKIKYLDFGAIQKYLKEHCSWEYEVFDRDSLGIKFFEMPILYNKYSRLIDVKISNSKSYVHQALSKTGMEALACGLEVFNYKNEVMKGLPDCYTPEFQCKSVIQVYKNLTQT